MPTAPRIKSLNFPSSSSPPATSQNSPPVSSRRFMSISPTDDAHRSASPSRALRENPRSSGHGSPRDPRRRPQIQTEGFSADRRGSARISAPEASNGAPAESSESAVSAFGDSSNKVIGFRLLDTTNFQNSGSILECQPTGREETTSQFRSDRFGPAQINGKSSGSHNLAAGAGGLQGNTAQPAARRHQVVNANHLLNFYYDPITRPQPRLPPPRRQRKIKPYNKDLFLQANYKFVVLDTGGYEVELTDPDKMMEWEDVICVKFSTPIPVQCPICLESPLCPQITSCGHIYCFPCILRYLLMGEEDHKGECWKKCPLCFMMISTKDLYTVLIENVKQFQVGDHAYFTLLTRPKDSLVPSLKNQQVECPMPCSSSSICDSFSKIVLTSDVELSVREAKLDLNHWLHKADSGLVDDLERLPYVCAALEQLEDRMKNWMENRTYSVSPPLRNSTSPANYLKIRHNKTQSQALNATANSDIANSDAWESAGGNTSLKHEITESSGKLGSDSSPVPLAAAPEAFENSEKVMLSCTEEKTSLLNSSSCKDSKEKDSYTFYQAIDGQHLILHPLNMKCLLHHHGSYDMLPARISGKILELETVTQTEAMRRRYRYLSHFSLTTTFQLCEIDLSDILPPHSLAPFMEEIKKRGKQRKQLARKEQEERVRAEVAAVQASLLPRDQRQYSPKDVTFSSDDFEALGSCSVPSTSPPVTGERKLFSDVTRLGFAAAHDSPSLRTEERTDLSGSMERMGGTSNFQGPRAGATLSFANIMSSPRTIGSPEAQKTNGFGKKGKKPTRVLLSTAGGRRY